MEGWIGPTGLVSATCVLRPLTVVFGIPRSASSSHTVSCWSLLIAARTLSMFSGALLVAGPPECGSLSTDTVPHFYLCCTLCIISEILNHLNSFYKWMFKLTQNLMQIHCCTCSAILNVTTTQYRCLLNGVYHPHWLVQWSYHCSHMCIWVHYPWLPGYIDVVQTVLIMLKMAGLFLDRPCIF